MGLPPALLARLKKRGIVNSQTKPKSAGEEQEEVIAENYGGDEESGGGSSDEDQDPHPSSIMTTSSFGGRPIKSALKSRASLGSATAVASIPRPSSPPSGPVPGCPNTSNPFHECSLYCKQRYANADKLSSGKKHVGFTSDTKTDSTSGNKLPKPEDEVEDKLPLPPFWVKVIDPASGYSYYWNRETDLVSWLHPLDEDAVITLAAAKLKEAAATAAAQVNASTRATPSEVQKKRAALFAQVDRDSDEEGDEDEDDEIVCPQCDRKTDSDGLCAVCDKGQAKQKSKQNSRQSGPGPGPAGFKGSKRARREEEQELDPMDPAAYDESVPRGTWSTGLVQTGTKAADSTAAGPLFQQRPYPSPGDVLRANRGAGGGDPNS